MQTFIQNSFDLVRFVPMIEQQIITMEMVKEKTIERFWSKIKFAGIDECWEWQRALTTAGYGMIGFGRKTLTYAHRYMYIQMFSDFDKSLQVLHQCDNPKCVNPNHLFSGTQQDNVDDCKMKGRKIDPPHLFGSKQNGAILTETDIPKIRERLSNGETGASIGRSYGVSKEVIHHIKKGNTWKHVN